MWCLVALSTAVGCKRDRTEDPLPGVDVGDMAADTRTDADLTPSEREAILAVEPSKDTSIPGLRAEVQVVYTAGNVPHIYAQNLHDAHMAAGFLIARDRFFELDIASRLALGEVSQLLGGFGLGPDLNSRGQGIPAVADRFLASMSDETVAAFDDFAAGVNAYAAAVRAGELPPPSEYALAAPLVGAASGIELIRDVDRRTLAGFAAFVVFESSFTDYDVSSELLAEQLDGHFTGAPLEALRQAGIEDDLFGNILPRHDLSVAPGWGLNGTLQTPLSLELPRPAPAGRVLGKLPPALRERLARVTNGQLWFGTRDASDRGSNAWAMAGDSTPDGSTLLAGDGHLALGVPTLFFQMGMDVRTFGDDSLRVVGLYLPGFPYLAVGTNGDVAWSQTYPRADVMDWYREELRLDANGLPASSLFKGTYEPLVQIDELYEVGPVLTDDPYDAIWPRWTTFDGRALREIEGRTVEDIDLEVLAPGESIVAMRGGFVVPADEDGDGVITAISVDFTGYDMQDLAASVNGLQRSTTVDEFLENMRGFTGYAQNLVVADRAGSVGFSNFTATPCRDYLPRDANGNWVAGADPQRLLDGTLYGGFEVPFANGLPVTGDADPQRCIVDYDVFPRVTRSTGFVANANNDPAGASFDNSLTNDPAYIGGPWVPGYRARAIVDGLEAAASRGATADDMAAVQGAQKSLVGIDFAAVIIDAVARATAAQTADPTSLTDAELRARDLYASRAPELTEAADRLQAWLDAGAIPASGVETFYNAPTAQDRTDAVATMIFNAWLRQWIAAVFADEQIDFLLSYPGRSRGAMMRALRTLVDGRGPNNPAGLSSWNAATQESVFFDNLDTPAIVEEHDEIALAALVATLDMLRSEPISGAHGGFGTTDMSGWLWGLRHRVVLDSLLASFGADTPAVAVIAQRFAINTTVLPLADNIGTDDPRKRLKWFPRPGDLFGVDAANPSFYGDSFDYTDGPVMRMVIELSADGGVRGRNVIPAGQSGLSDSPHFADQAKLWLANDALDIQWAPADVAAAAVEREVLKP